MIQNIVSRTASVLILLAGSMLFVQCGDPPDNRNPSVDEDTVSEYQTTLNTAYIKEREELRSDLEDLRGELDGRIEKLDSRIEEVDEETGENLVSMREELREDRSEVQRAIENLHNSSQDSWNRVKTETENLYNDILSKLERQDDWPQDRHND